MKVLLVILFAFSLTVSMYSDLAADGSRPAGDDPPRGGNHALDKVTGVIPAPFFGGLIIVPGMGIDKDGAGGPNEGHPWTEGKGTLFDKDGAGGPSELHPWVEGKGPLLDKDGGGPVPPDKGNPHT